MYKIVEINDGIPSKTPTNVPQVIANALFGRFDLAPHSVLEFTQAKGITFERNPEEILTTKYRMNIRQCAPGVLSAYEQTVAKMLKKDGGQQMEEPTQRDGGSSKERLEFTRSWMHTELKLTLTA